MGLFKMKSEGHPIEVWFYSLGDDKFFYCTVEEIVEKFRVGDFKPKIPLEIKRQFLRYLRDELWLEEGGYDEEGYMLSSSKCLVFTSDGGEVSSGPNEDDPGKQHNAQ